MLLVHKIQYVAPPKTTALSPLTHSNNSFISSYSQQQQPYIPLLAAITAIRPQQSEVAPFEELCPAVGKIGGVSRVGYDPLTDNWIC
jgi:hypothetical protein